jgi:hypothetical protein
MDDKDIEQIIERLSKRHSLSRRAAAAMVADWRADGKESPYGLEVSQAALGVVVGNAVRKALRPFTEMASRFREGR